MVHFIIAGIADCPNYARALFIAKFLESCLPNFSVSYLPFNPADWTEWLRVKNIECKWHHRRSPLIYKELLYHGGTPYLIGGTSEFWEYCYDYYGLNSILSKQDIDYLIKNNIENYEKSNLLKSSANYGRNILFYGIKNKIIYMLIPHLFQIEGLLLNERLYIKFYQEDTDEESNDIFEDLHRLLKEEYNTQSEVVGNLGNGLRDVDLLIITEKTYMLTHDQPNITTLIYMSLLSDEISNCAKRSIKIIFANEGLTCHAATILYKHCDFKINLAVVSSDQALGPLEIVSKKFNLDKRKLFAPPVWGFNSEDLIIDINSTVMKCNVHKPYQRAKRISPHSDLLLGTIYTEFRFLSYLTYEDPDTKNNYKVYKSNTRKKLGTSTSKYAKLTSLISVLKIWFSPNNKESTIISLGIPSNGSFGIPKGLVFSQPAVLINNEWEPYKHYPVNAEIKKGIDNLIVRTEKTIMRQQKYWQKHFFADIV